MKYKTQGQMHRVISNVVRLLHENGIDKIEITYKGNEVFINTHKNGLYWEILEGMVSATDNPPCTWSVITSGGELQIVLENDL